MKLLILSGDKVVKTIKLSRKFLFIVPEQGDKLFYLDSTIGSMWYTQKATLANLGEGHKKVLKKHIK